MRNSPRNLPVRMCAHFHVFAWLFHPLERVIILVMRPAKGSRLTPPLITWINQVIHFHWLINQGGGSAQVLPPHYVLKPGCICINASSWATCAAQVNYLPAISYLVLKRGVWSLPSPPIKHIRSSLTVICLFSLVPQCRSSRWLFSSLFCVGSASCGCGQRNHNVNSGCVPAWCSLLCLSLC